MSQTYATNDPVPSAVPTAEAMSTAPKLSMAERFSPKEIARQEVILPEDIIYYIRKFIFQNLCPSDLLMVGCFTSDFAFSQIMTYNDLLLPHTLSSRSYQGHVFLYLLTEKFPRILNELENCVENKICSTFPGELPNTPLISEELLAEFKAIADIVNFESPKALKELAELAELAELESSKAVEKYKTEKRLAWMSALNKHDSHIEFLEEITSDINIYRCVQGGEVIRVMTKDYLNYCEKNSYTPDYYYGGAFNDKYVNLFKKPAFVEVVSHQENKFDNFARKSIAKLDAERVYEYKYESDFDPEIKQSSEYVDIQQFRKDTQQLNEQPMYEKEYSMQINCDQRILFIKTVLNFHKELKATKLIRLYDRNCYNEKLFKVLTYALLDPRSETTCSNREIFELVQELCLYTHHGSFVFTLKAFKACGFYTEKMMDLICSAILKSPQSVGNTRIEIIELLSQKKQVEVLTSDRIIQYALQATFKFDTYCWSRINVIPETNADKLDLVIKNNPVLSEMMKSSNDLDVANVLGVVLQFRKIVNPNDPLAYTKYSRFLRDNLSTIEKLIHKHCV